MSAPSIHAVRGGFEATCGKCLHPSEAVEGNSPEGAWAALLELGWTLYKQGYALCAACTKDPPNVDKDARGLCGGGSGVSVSLQM
jgi:hypothetical protein